MTEIQPSRDAAFGELDVFPALDDRADWREASPGPPESIGGVIVFVPEVPRKCRQLFGHHRGYGDVRWINFVYCRG